MPQQKRMPGTARLRRSSWKRGSGLNSFQCELKGGIALNKKYLSRKVRHSADADIPPKGNGYRKVCGTLKMVNFT